MSSLKQDLYATIDLLTDEEASQTLRFVAELKVRRILDKTPDSLGDDSAFRLPLSIHRAFSSIDPVRGSGADASRMLIEDRR